MRDFWHDVRYAVRGLSRSQGFTAITILTLALGIGANTAIFQLLDAVRMRTLPVKNPQELAEVRIADMEGVRGSFSIWHAAVTHRIWEQLRDRQQAFSGLFVWSPGSFNLSPSGEARFASGLLVSGEFFNTLGVRPILGRVLTSSDDDRRCNSLGAVISYGFWQKEYGGDPSVVGRKLTLEHYPFEIIGVTPASFTGLEVGKNFDLAVPLCVEGLPPSENSRLDSGVDWWLIAMGRLKPGWTLEKASAHLSAISPGIFQASLAPNYPRASVSKYLGFKLAAFPVSTGVSLLREQYSDPLWFLLAISGLVLLIACANLANLMLARAASREREMAVCLALGASRGRLVRHLLAESLLLATAGALLGAWLAGVPSRFLVNFINTESNPLFLELTLDWRMLLFTAVVALLTCALFGLTPALRATRVSPEAVLRASGRGMTAGAGRFGLRRLLVVSQVALSLVLLVAALLFTRSLRNLMTLSTGLQEDGILITYADMSRLNLPPERRQESKQDLVRRLERIPGVLSAAETNIVPLANSSWTNNVWMDGSDSTHQVESHFASVSSGYFKTMGIALLAGRDFNETDTPKSPNVAVVNEAFARQLLHGANPVGKRFWREATPSTPETVLEIVGFVKDAKYSNLRQALVPTAYTPSSQSKKPDSFAQILIHSNMSMSALLPVVKEAIRQDSPDITPTFQVFKEMIRDSLVKDRLMGTLSGFFGFLAVLLATIGLYGVVSFTVAQRTNEIGIRMALGADRGAILGMVLREAFVLLAIGVGAGTALVLAVGRTASALLFGLKPYDPPTLAIAIAILAAVAVSASYLPAWRASHVDPMVALRYE